MRYRCLDHQYPMVFRTSRLQEATEKLNGQWQFAIQRKEWSPPTDVYETENVIFIRIDLAGVDLKSLEAMFYKDAFILEGERRLMPFEAEGIYHLSEIRQGKFQLELPLAKSVFPKPVEIQYEQGLLRITLEKRNK